MLNCSHHVEIEKVTTSPEEHFGVDLVFDEFRGRQTNKQHALLIKGIVPISM